jgi:hypothetical protein
MPSGSGTPRAIICFLSEAFSPWSRAISLSSAARSSGTAWQVQSPERLLHVEIRLLGLARALLGSFLHVPGDVGASVLIAFPVVFFMYFVPGLGPHQLSQRLGLVLAFPQFP